MPRVPQARTIRSRLLAILLVAIVVLAAIAAGIWRLALKPALAAGVERTQQEIAGRSADQIGAFIEQRIGELVAAADFGSFWEDRRERQREILRQLIKLSPAVSDIAIAYRDGHEVLRVSRSRLYTTADLGSLAGQEKFETALLGGTYIGEVYHPPTAEPHVTIAVPIWFTPRETGGVLVAEINLKTLWDPISHIRVGETGSVYVTDRRGRLLAHRDYSKVLLGTVIAQPPALWGPSDTRQPGDTPARVVTRPDGRAVLTSSAVVPRPQWTVVVEEPVETALAGVARVERLALGLMLTALAVGAAFAVWFSGRIARPVRQLEVGAAIIAGGRLTHRLEIRTGDEIQRLAEEFNAMATRLQASREDLERRVAETTRHLSALYALVAPLSRAGDLGIVLDGILAKIIELTDADGGLIRLLDGEFCEAVAPLDDASEGEASPSDWPPEGEALLRRVLAEGEPVILADAAHEGESFLTRRLGSGLRSAAILPLATAERQLGGMVLVSGREAAFGRGQVELFRAISRHVSLALENARLYDQARQTTEFLQSIAKSTDPIFTADIHGIVTYVSPRAVEVFGYSPAEVLGQRASEWYAGGVDEARRLMDRLTSDGHIQNYETTVRSRTRGLVDVSSSLSLLRDADDRVIGTVAVVRDITQEKHLREQLRQAQKMEAIGRLAGGIAHDFNNLLTVIIGRAQLLLRSQPSPPLALKLIRSTAERAAELTRQLLAFSRRQRLERRVQDLNATVSGVAAMLRRLIGEDVDLSINLGSGELWVDADRTQLEQVLLNLAVNARDAMPRGGRLQIETSIQERGVDADDAAGAPGPYAVLSVTDTGVGMDAQTISHIFEPFFTTKGPGKGTGLGLATVYGIVSQHDGHIRVNSAPGLGTTFRVYLPKATPPALPADERDDARALPGGSETVLLVEDEKPVRELVSETLTAVGYQVLEASDPQAALRAAGAHGGPIDLLLADVVMPGMNGRQLAERVIALRPGIRVLYMSGYTGDALDRHGVSDQSPALIYKPFTPDVLLQRVRSTLDANRPVPA